MADHGTSGTKEIKSEHKLVQSINGRKTIYCSPGHVVGIVNLNSDARRINKFFIFSPNKRKFFL